MSSLAIPITVRIVSRASSGMSAPMFSWNSFVILKKMTMTNAMTNTMTIAIVIVKKLMMVNLLLPITDLFFKLEDLILQNLHRKQILSGHVLGCLRNQHQYEAGEHYHQVKHQNQHQHQYQHQDHQERVEMLIRLQKFNELIVSIVHHCTLF